VRRLNFFLFLACVLMITTAAPSAAKMATIQTTAPLRDHGEQTVKRAIQDAVESAVTGAIAMGLPWVQLGRAIVLEDAVAVQILATDTNPDARTGEEAPGSDSESAPSAEDPPETEF
jgi:hypothetical protein